MDPDFRQDDEGYFTEGNANHKDRPGPGSSGALSVAMRCASARARVRIAGGTAGL